MAEKYFTKMKHDVPFLKRALWETYDRKCFYCGNELMVKEVEVEHIWPGKKAEMFNTEPYIELYNKMLEYGFEIETLENYVVSCGSCNKRKARSPMRIESYPFYYTLTFRRRDNVLKKIRKFQREVDIDDVKNNEQKILDMEKQKTLFVDRHVIDTYGSVFYVNGAGHTCIRAFIPKDYDAQMTCNINTEELNKSELTYTMTEEEMKKYLFVGCGKELQERKWCQKFADEPGRKNYQIILPNIRVDASFEEVSELASIADDLFEEYLMQESRIKAILGSEGFACAEYGKVKILTISKTLWEEIKEFSYDHPCSNGLSEWNIFNIINNTRLIQICPNDHEQTKYEDSDENPVIITQFVAEEANNMMNIYWLPGFCANELDKMSFFDNERKWKVDYAHDWMLEELIPYVSFMTLPRGERIKYRSYKDKSFFNKYVTENENIISYKEEI